MQFVTKYHHVDPLLGMKHKGCTRIRFSINSDYAIRQFEPGTSRFHERIEAAGKVAAAGYPLGFIIAPIIWYDGWQEGYSELLSCLADALPSGADEGLTFEFIQHRFSKTAKTLIETAIRRRSRRLDMEKRKKKRGRRGQNKYVYPDEQQNALRELITERIFGYFPKAVIDYFT